MTIFLYLCTQSTQSLITIIHVVSQKTKNADILNVMIRARQWMHMWALGTEWKEQSAKKELFILCEQGM
jgi:hypothetical protein